MTRHAFPANAAHDLKHAAKPRRRTVADHGSAYSLADIIGSASDRHAA